MIKGLWHRLILMRMHELLINKAEMDQFTIDNQLKDITKESKRVYPN